MKPRLLCEEAIAEVLVQRVEPLLALDSAEVAMVRLDPAAKVVHLRLGGRYAGCPSRRVVLDGLIAPLLLQEFPELQAIKLVD